MLAKIPVTTTKKHQIIDITKEVEAHVRKSDLKEATAVIFAKHTTCAVIITELEPALEKDLLAYFESEGPKGPFTHSHGAESSHTPAHIFSALHGQSRKVPVESGQMQLGTWQRICLAEFDGPRDREVLVQIS